MPPSAPESTLAKIRFEPPSGSFSSAAPTACQLG